MTDPAGSPHLGAGRCFSSGELRIGPNLAIRYYCALPPHPGDEWHSTQWIHPAKNTLVTDAPVVRWRGARVTEEEAAGWIERYRPPRSAS